MSSSADSPPFNDPEDSLSDTEEIVSKSQRKREMLALQELGKKLTEINDQLLEKCQLPADLSIAVQDFKRLPNKHEARRRQLQYIGKLMRSVDTDLIEKVLEQDQQSANLNKRFFKQMEELREKLLAGSEETLQSLITEHPDLDIQYLRQLIRQAQKEQVQNKAPSSSRKLFQYLRELKQTD
ncbi:MAG: ribosome biogenesis factor YjgA [Pseudohongiellaceae bacterium]